MVIDGYGLDNISNLATSTNMRSLDMDYVQVNDLSAISTMENLKYIRLASGSELVKNLKKRVFDTEGQIAKLKMKLLTTI